ncbi:ABC-2 type transport system ATP-binding protein [Geodermatophilus saharensis]|uniref:ABC-2 type transport system ATP-binding protein n=1 Tax=Geodermatophilus saharensis TaxID=1137994 RepID=A0A239G9A3_9ACTN|nr:ABC transporter ATP-binding protein [Geodermatophilus saharensis]SNS65023.1 ABC-2 type transport system ATP-binding protein [Geodermatophilus saharensis]
MIEIRDLVKVYRGRRGTVRANDGITLHVGPGEVFGLLGHNGAGKTTLLSQVVGLLRPTGGSIHLDGCDLVARPALARSLCSLQQQAQVPMVGITPRAAVELTGRIRGGGRREVVRRGAALAAALDIERWYDTPGEKLSGGVLRLVSFAMAAVEPGRVVMLDEPSNDVDPVRRRLLWQEVRRLADEGTAVLLVTHAVAEAERVVDRLAVLDRGRVVAEATPSALKGGADADLRVELVLPPGRPAPVLPPCVHDAHHSGPRLVARAPADAADAVGHWLVGQQRTGAVEEWHLGALSLEDVYVRLVGEDADRAGSEEVHRAALVR